jgi:hypothetical protein
LLFRAKLGEARESILRARNITGFIARSSEKVGDKAAGGKCPEATLHLVVEDI